MQEVKLISLACRQIGKYLITVNYHVRLGVDRLVFQAVGCVAYAIIVQLYISVPAKGINVLCGTEKSRLFDMYVCTTV